uniref:CBM6 domain-containing protein n=1 Tax=Plectus sambesii TaxID=2011161 RepID=A0A914UTN3_9BILA
GQAAGDRSEEPRVQVAVDLSEQERALAAAEGRSEQTRARAVVDLSAPIRAQVVVGHSEQRMAQAAVAHLEEPRAQAAVDRLGQTRAKAVVDHSEQRMAQAAVDLSAEPRAQVEVDHLEQIQAKAAVDHSEEPQAQVGVDRSEQMRAKVAAAHSGASGGGSFGTNAGESGGGSFGTDAGESGGGSFRSGNTSSTARTPRVSQFPSMCAKTDCMFDSASSFCSYQVGGASSLTLPNNAAVTDWRLSDQQVSNSLTGIFSDVSGNGMYVFAGNTNDRNDYFLMSTPSFTVKENSRLEFYLYLAGIEGRFRVCVDNLTSCPFESLGKNIKIDSRKWRDGFVELTPGAHTVHFVADNLKKNYVIGLDQIQLLNAAGTSAAPCT